MNFLKFFLIGVIVSLCFTSRAENSLSISYAHTDIGRNLRVGFEKKLYPTLSVEAGVKYIIWKDVNDLSNYTYKNRFKPQTNKEHYGLFFNTKYYFYRHNPSISPFISYDLNISRSSLLNENYLSDSKLITDSLIGAYTIYKRQDAIFKPCTVIEQYVRVGIDIALSKNIVLSESLGLGLANFYKVDQRLSPSRKDSEVGTFLHIGLKYQLNKPSRTQTK